MQAKHLVPNAFTMGNIALGFMGILASAAGNFRLACIYLFWAAMCDMADGRLARLLNASSKFGMELDSLSDMVSFGLAPAIMVYLAALKSLGPIGLLPPILYALCGAARLARYNIESGDDSAHHVFKGVPIPIAASYMFSFVLVRESLPPWLIAAGTATAAIAMVSTVKIPKFRKGGLPIAMMFFGLGLFIVFLIRPGALTWHLWNSWNAVLIAANYILLARREKA